MAMILEYFDQRKALGILESFAEGNFNEVMDYDFGSWQSFSKVAMDYIPSRRHQAFYAEMKKTFEG